MIRNISSNIGMNQFEEPQFKYKIKRDKTIVNESHYLQDETRYAKKL